jgi:hypothetical protein
VRVVEEYVEIDIAVILRPISETRLESIDSYKNAILSVYFYKKNSVFFVIGIQISLNLIGIYGDPY